MQDIWQGSLREMYVRFFVDLNLGEYSFDS